MCERANVRPFLAQFLFNHAGLLPKRLNAFWACVSNGFSASGRSGQCHLVERTFVRHIDFVTLDLRFLPFCKCSRFPRDEITVSLLEPCQ